MAKPKKKIFNLPGRPVLIACDMSEGKEQGGMQIMVDIAPYDEPGVWGIILSDMIENLANAYAQEGHDRDRVQTDIRNILIAEFMNPTAAVELLGKVEM